MSHLGESSDIPPRSAGCSPWLRSFLGSAIVDVKNLMIRTKWNELIQVAKIGGDRFDLRFGQAMRDRFHDC
jgi:hypothetical protein